jgi:hypothetical protein
MSNQISYNLYQSNIRQHIQIHIYKKPFFHVDFLDKTYFGMIKKKHMGPASVQRYQILWVTLDSFLSNQEKVLTDIQYIKKTLASHWWDIFIQVGFVDTLCSYHSVDLKKIWYAQDIKNHRIYLEKMLLDRFDLHTTVRENMPMANITIDCTLGRDVIQANFSTSCRTHIKKAIGQKFYFESQASIQDIDDFFVLRQETMQQKWVHTITKSMYHALLDYLWEWNKWGLYVVKKNNTIVAGSICIIDGPVMLYLYGASDRSRGHTWGHHLLKSHLIQYAIARWCTLFDFFGAAPSWYDDHHLLGVSRFKESFGWNKTEYYGSYDIVTNKLLYQLMRMR